MKKTKKLINRIGLDRTVIAGFRIVSIDYEKLLEHKNVTIERDGKHTYLLEDGSSFRFLIIKDYCMFGVMCAGVRKTKYMKQDYSRMDIVISDEAQGNLQNKTVKEYKHRIEEIFCYLYEEYGIVVDLQYLRFSEMEINCTFKIKEEFYKYHRVLRLVMYNLPKTFKKIRQVLDVDKEQQRFEAETFYRANSSMVVKIYDKKKHLEQKRNLILNGQIIRIEFVLKNSQKINAIFKSALVTDLTDEKLNDYYFSEFLRLIERPYRNWQVGNRKQLKKLISDFKSKSRNYWKSNLLRYCSNEEQENQIPVLLDIKDLLIQVKKIENNGHYARVENSILEQCKYNDIYLNNDADKMEEIISQVHEAYDNYQEDQELVEVLDSPISGEVA